MEVIKYNSSLKYEWDKFIAQAKNQHFMFYRDYMEYHSDRFQDHSLLVYKDGALIACFPANVNENVLYSHQGLTFGGFITNEKMTTSLMLEVFSSVIDYAKKNNIKEIVYKCIPYIYHSIPAEEDRYALFINDVQLWRRDVTTTIYLDNKIEYQERRTRSIKKAQKNGVTVSESNEFERYWEILTENLYSKYKTKPVHSVQEIQHLHSLFPNNIKLYIASQGSDIIAGVVVYLNPSIVHCQYIASNDDGKSLGALDIIFDFLINHFQNSKKYFDFGISNEQDGRYLNSGLIEFKEGFGARAVCQDFYRLEIK